MLRGNRLRRSRRGVVLLAWYFIGVTSVYQGGVSVTHGPFETREQCEQMAGWLKAQSRSYTASWCWFAEPRR